MSAPLRIWLTLAPAGVWTSGPVVSDVEPSTAKLEAMGYTIQGPYVLEAEVTARSLSIVGEVD